MPIYEYEERLCQISSVSDLKLRGQAFLKSVAPTTRRRTTTTRWV